MKLNGKIALITGGNRGIGRGISLEIANAGADIAIFYKNNSRQAEKTLEDLKQIGVRTHSIQVDVSNINSVIAGVKVVLDKFGKIDILVNNAGINLDNFLINMDYNDWNEVINSNLNSVYNCTKVVLEHMKARGYGKIINIASLGAFVGNIGQTNYCAAKAGVVGFTKSLAAEVGKYGVFVNAIGPGAIETDMLKNIPEKIVEKIRKRVPLNRLGKPEDIAYVAVFLASEDSDYICGQTIIVDGGLGLSTL
ncbi:3-oxoacyl-ACP reductase family protein [Lutispora sp.]|uniref:3-oxoacyl-ACP reductase family protein n=1 Tax=Lutispora sp. TaxID=2828727 RepID=UPI002B21848C|nr:3-oxoacyl-ACP reductase family protein [Lutispora sp.]MEA4962224.1 3-oxoacyl-ACP reductase family protein [Lutispora sp.]